MDLLDQAELYVLIAIVLGNEVPQPIGEHPKPVCESLKTAYENKEKAYTAPFGGAGDNSVEFKCIKKSEFSIKEPTLPSSNSKSNTSGENPNTTTSTPPTYNDTTSDTPQNNDYDGYEDTESSNYYSEPSSNGSTSKPSKLSSKNTILELSKDEPNLKVNARLYEADKLGGSKEDKQQRENAILKSGFIKPLMYCPE